MRIQTYEIIRAAMAHDPDVTQDHAKKVLLTASNPDTYFNDPDPRLLKTKEAAGILGESVKVFIARSEGRGLTRRDDGKEFKWLEREVRAIVEKGDNALLTK